MTVEPDLRIGVAAPGGGFRISRLDLTEALAVNTEAWYGTWHTLGNATGSVGFPGQPTAAPATTVGSGGVTLPLAYPSTVPVADCAMLNANGGSFTLGGHVVVYSGRSASSGAGNATGCHTLSTATGTYAAGTALGYTSIGFGPLAIYEKFGVDTPNAPVPGSTQGAFLIAAYYGPTVDDSAEGLSAAAILKDTGTPFIQHRPLTGFEAIAQVEGGNSLSSDTYALGIGSRLNVLGTAHVPSGFGFKASVNTSGGPPYGTIDRYAAFEQEVGSGATLAYGVYVADPVNSETALTLGKSAYSGTLSAKLTGNSDSGQTMLLLNLPSAADAPGTLTGIRIVGPASQTKPLQEWYGAGSGTPGSRVDSGGNLASRTAIKLMDATFSSDIIKLDPTALTLTAGINIVLAATTGTKLGTATSQKLGFWNATPVVQPAGTPAAATDAATTQALVNSLRASLITIGLVA